MHHEDMNPRYREVQSMCKGRGQAKVADVIDESRRN